MKPFYINFAVACLLMITGLIIRIVSDNFLLTVIFLGLAIVEGSYAIISYHKARK